MKSGLRTLISIWVSWFVVLYGFQWLVTTRLQVQRPDHAVEWAMDQTRARSNDGKIYLLDPFMNRQVAWDSEYYLGIAVGGYDDPNAGVVQNPDNGQLVIKNYSFFPFYPYLIKAFMMPLSLLRLTPIGTATLAAIIVSLLGTLAGMVALWDMTCDLFDEESASRAAFYLLIFPTAFFFAQVYTEGLFIGLAFSSIALSRRKQWFWASLLAMLAAWTRAHGAALVLPLGIAWLTSIDWKSDMRSQFTFRLVAQGVCALLPLAAYLLWRYSPLGEGWAELQSFYFGRGLLPIGKSITDWGRAIHYAFYVSREGLIYMLIEIFSILLALSASIWLIRRDPQIGSFSLAVILLSVFSGAAHSMARYMLVSPAMYVLLARWGKNRAFDRAWTIASLLLMGMSVMLFSYDMWVG